MSNNNLKDIFTPQSLSDFMTNNSEFDEIRFVRKSDNNIVIIGRIGNKKFELKNEMFIKPYSEKFSTSKSIANGQKSGKKRFSKFGYTSQSNNNVHTEVMRNGELVTINLGKENKENGIVGFLQMEIQNIRPDIFTDTSNKLNYYSYKVESGDGFIEVLCAFHNPLLIRAYKMAGDSKFTYV